MKGVYMINGFLESGKSEFITYTLAQPYFQIKGRTLVILCEEGEVEYDSALLARCKAVLEVLEDEEDFTPECLAALEKKHKPDRIIIEYNGMWNFKNMKLPRNWKLEQQITIIDGSTFPVYYTNMRSLLAEMLRNSELIIFNRCDGVEDLAAYRRNVKAVNPKAEIVFEDKDGEIDEIFEDDLPYDLNQDTIVLDDESYGIWYLDSMDHPRRYEGKTLEFTAMAMITADMPKGMFLPGRLAMTCCADDMAFLGYLCEYAGAASLKQKEWVRVAAKVSVEYREEYRAEGPVLHAVSVQRTKAPKEEVISFV